MKIAIARGPGLYGGIFRRFRELCSYCEGRHEVVGIMPLAREDAELSWPARTLARSYHHVSMDLLRAVTIEDVRKALEPLTEKIAEDIEQENPDKILAVDTDLKGVCVIDACKRLGRRVTTFVAGLSSQVEAHNGRSVQQQYMPAVEQYTLEESDHLIFPSRFAAEYAVTLYPKTASFTVIHNGIANEFLNAVRSAGESKKIGAVMRLEGIKNPETLGRIGDELRMLGYELELITSVAKAWHIPKSLSSVTLVPPTSSNDELARFYAQCRAIVSPSKFEASGNVPMEAIAVGTPPIITDQMGINELFYELGLAHLVVGVDDVDATIDRLVNAEPIPEEVRGHVRQTYAWPAICDRIISTL